jgi:redox-sensitive bicupin YhaK (pirin superfamily)
VRRTLPTATRSLIGAWCFIDHFGPNDVADGGMQVLPHPHTGLQTVSWLFTGEIEHRDSAGHHAYIKPGELNLMTAGRGIAHSEMSTANESLLHGMQLWIALPEEHRFTEPTFTHYVPQKTMFDGGHFSVFIGEFLGAQSPVRMFSELVGVELNLDAGKTIAAALKPQFEYGFIVDRGNVIINDIEISEGQLLFLPVEHDLATITAETDVRLLILGGTPLGESIVMWWNFIGRTHDEIVEFRAQWNAEIDGSAQVIQFGHPYQDSLEPLRAPELPPVRLRSRS